MPKMKITKRQLRRIIREAVEPLGYEEEAGYGDPGQEDRDELMRALRQKFRLGHVRTTEAFNGQPGGIWLHGESGVPETETGLPMYDYYMQMDPYEFGVHPEFSRFIEDHGFFAEWRDPGTLMLYRM